MPYTIQFAADTVTCTYDGDTGTDELLGAMSRVARHDNIRKMNLVTLDFSQITSFLPDDDAVVYAAGQIQACRSANPELRVEVVGSSQDLLRAKSMLELHLGMGLQQVQSAWTISAKLPAITTFEF